MATIDQHTGEYQMPPTREDLAVYLGATDKVVIRDDWMLADFIYTGGGSDYQGGALLDTTNSYKYDPATDTWSQVGPLPKKRTSGILKDLGDSLIFTTGHPGFNTDTWIGTFS